MLCTAALVYTAIALAYYHPMSGAPSRAIAGWIDARENYWNLWWARRVLLERPANPYHATVMQYPYGISLLFHTFNLANGVLSLPFQLLGGIAFAYNMVNLLALVLAGSGMFALVRYIVRSTPAALIGGLIYAFNPYIAFHIDAGQTNLLAIEWMPWYFLALLLGLRGHWAWLPLASLLLLANALTDWHYIVFLGIITAITALYEAPRLGRTRAILSMLGKLGAMAALFVLLVSPVLLPMLRELSGDASALRDLQDSLNHSADLLAFVLPSPFHPWWGKWAGAIFYGRLVPQHMVGGLASLGFATLALAIGGASARRQDWALFAVIALAGAVLALGPYLRVNGAVLELGGRPVPLPYIVFNRLPLMSTVRVPSRFVLVSMFGLAVLAGMGLASLLERLRTTQLRRYGAAVAPMLVAAVVMFEYWPAPFRTTPTTPEQVSPFYLQLGADQSEYAIVDVPYGEARSMFWQTFHGKATLGARIARPRSHPWTDARFFGPLLSGKPPELGFGADDSAAAWQNALACQNVRYVTFYKDFEDPERAEQTAQLEAALFGNTAPAYEDAMLRAYGPLIGTAREAYWTPIKEQWYAAEQSPQGQTFSWLNGDSGSMLAFPCGARAVLLRFSVYSYAIPRTLEIRLNGTLVHTLELPAQAEQPFELPLQLRDGENTINFRSVQPATNPADLGVPNDDRALAIMFTKVSMRSTNKHE